MRLIFSRPSLRQLLPVLFFLLAAIPAGAIGLLLTNNAWDRELQTVREQHLQLARNLAEALVRYAEDVEAVFQMTVVSVPDLPEGVLGQKLPELLRRLHFKHICIVNDSGQVEHFISPEPDLKSTTRISSTLLEKLRASEARVDQAPEFSDVLLDHKGEPTLFLWQRLENARYALGALKTDYFVQLQSAISFGKKGHAAIVDRSGHVIAHPNPQWRATIKDISQVEPVRRMMTGGTGVLRFFSPAVQADMVAGFTTTPKTGWGVMIPQPVSELEAHVGRVKRAVWSVIGLALLCATTLGGLVSRWLGTPLSHVGSVAERFANGAYEARVMELGAFHTREATILAAQFNAMADEVNHRRQEQYESEQRFRTFAEIAANWFWETDCQQVFTYHSPPSKSGRHWDSDALLGHHRSEHIHGDPEGKAVSLIQSYMDRGAPFDNVEYQVLGSDGQPIDISVAGIPIRDDSGAIVGYRGVAHDITERLRYQAQLRQHEKLVTVGTLAAKVAHEVNNPLAIIKTSFSVLHAKMPPDDANKEDLLVIEEEINRIARIIGQLLDFSRPQSDVAALQVNDLIQNLTKFVEKELFEHNIRVDLTLFPTLPEVRISQDHLKQVLLNLIKNAQDAMPTGGVLRIQTDKQPDGVLVSLIDQGVGIPDAHIHAIFEPFFSTKRHGEGMGLGLAVSYNIIKNCGGTIEAESQLDKGTTFRIFLPEDDTATVTQV